ncbi:MAG: hypothetical protein R3F11_25260 [Verrucomicrobiales bacterium]
MPDNCPAHIVIALGQAGGQIAAAFWRLLMLEHGSTAGGGARRRSDRRLGGVFLAGRGR